MKYLIVCLSLFLFSNIYCQDNLDILPHLETPLTDSIGLKSQSNSVNLKSAQWDAYGFKELEKYVQEFDYSIIGQIKTKGHTLMLVSRSYIEEEIHWLCLMDANYILIDHIQTAYKNSEGFLTKKSIIEELYLDVIEWNDFEEVKQVITKYQITPKSFVK